MLSSFNRRRAALAAVATAALAALALLALLLLGSDDGERSAGPLGTDEVQALSFNQEPGRAFTFGLAVAFNRGDEPAVLERIALIDPTPGLEVFATRVAGPERRILFRASDSNWPSPQITDVRPVAGFEVAPESEPDGERGVELVFGARAQDPGRYQARGVSIDYRVGDTEHRAKLDIAFAVCILQPGADTDNAPRCRPPKLGA